MIFFLLALESINFIMVALYKYDVLKNNLSKAIKAKLNIEFGDYQKEKYEFIKEV